MKNLIRGAYRYWLDESVGVGTAARWLRRKVHERTHKPHREGNIAMLHAGRCGSSVLADMLNQHPDVRWANEPFEVMKPAYRKMAGTHRARRLLADRMYRERARYFGFDSKYLPEQHLRPEMAHQSLPSYIALLEDLGFRHFILLNRRNHLRRAVSVAVGRKTGQWNTQGVAARATVRLEPERFVSYGQEMPLLAYFRSLDETYEELRRLVAKHGPLELTYEEHIQADPAVAYRRACEFLGIEKRDVPVRLKKINPQPLRELIENFDEVARTLGGTPYAWMLDG